MTPAQPEGGASVGEPDSEMPAIPGQLLWGREAYQIRAHAAGLAKTAPGRFPGAQPVSLTRTAWQTELMQTDYMVCEKSDGVRVLVLMAVDARDGISKTYMLTRKNEVYVVPGVAFPEAATSAAAGAPLRWHNDTLIDAELVVDTERDGRRVRRLLGFDALAVGGSNCMDKPLDRRLGLLVSRVVNPFVALCARQPPARRDALPFQAEMKRFERSYAIAHIYDFVMPTLKHKSDGLIFTSVAAPYTPGTCQTILKWKPSNENSVDFKACVSPLADGSPAIQLLAVRGAGAFTYVDNLAMQPGDWDRLFKPMGASLNGSIIEAVYDPEYAPPFKWRFLRFRTDKPNPNYYRVLVNIQQSIRDNVELDELKQGAHEMRLRWKQRNPEPKPA
ncbi:Dcp1p-Dcp2p decapping enzyme complex alpha subunit [Coemansia sp. RSA 2049]|nr:Dcp1p-Dcp2p decapping enzyme complex alpha subunit [Coemansia sp. RSA 1939]KAJ2520147.1 Dcp1p-Dcp2p decapping enzyme complex alpha subunit [Coemansia sp. RSA 2049]KAJ2607002.1 Dcp1p-Dcp2p decapping enzyme complex alpha subunit [Coemansia sp. RSA 1804]KAJ2688739.1 Dcp1p-Dcp2p decapping enzyme complex alpha subunit [Coemansia sp. RSA 1285]